MQRLVTSSQTETYYTTTVIRQKNTPDSTFGVQQVTVASCVVRCDDVPRSQGSAHFHKQTEPPPRRSERRERSCEWGQCQWRALLSDRVRAPGGGSWGAMERWGLGSTGPERGGPHSVALWGPTAKPLASQNRCGSVSTGQDDSGGGAPPPPGAPVACDGPWFWFCCGSAAKA
ncbi:unnamed protein product [Boreogadus saida]